MKVKADREESSPYAGKKSTYFNNPDMVVFSISSDTMLADWSNAIRSILNLVFSIWLSQKNLSLKLKFACLAK